MQKWIVINDEYVSRIKHLAKRKIRLQGKPVQEVSVYWDKKEGCFFSPAADYGWYMDNEKQRPTHILVG